MCHAVKLYEVIQTKKTLYLVMEYCSGGEVFDYLVAHGRMKEKEAREKFRQVSMSVRACVCVCVHAYVRVPVCVCAFRVCSFPSRLCLQYSTVTRSMLSTEISR